MTPPTGSEPADAPGGRTLDRRRFLRSAGAVGVIAAAGAAGAVADHELRSDRPVSTTRAAPAVSFYGTHQPGVVGAAPAHLRFVAYDLTESARARPRAALAAALQRVTPAIAGMMAGRWIPEQAGLAAGLQPAGLTITVGLGPSVIDQLRIARPATLTAIPAFAGDALDPDRSDGDLGVQICGDDPLVVASVVQALTTLLAPDLKPRWAQNGFLPTTAARTDPGSTPRNLMGQLDGTDNPTGSRLQIAVWAAAGTTPAWMVNGTYLVCRRIRMLLPDWFTRTPAEREAVIGRSLASGAPLSGGTEKSTPDFSARGADGRPLIADNAHVRLTHPSNNGGATMLRRGYSYDDGLRSDGTADSGLFFQAFQADPQAAFVAIQQRLATDDALSVFVRHESSALFAVLPGVSSGEWLGHGLLDQ